VETRNKQGTRGTKQNTRKQQQQRQQVEVDKEDIPKTTGEEENNTQIQPYAREKSGSRDQIFRFDGKEYTSYSEMVQAKREWNRRVLLESGLLDTTK
jgi:N-acetylmuramoyl-L-alanine amidase CwlA